MLGKTLNLYRAEVTLNGETSNIYFENHHKFDEYVKMFCKEHKGDDFEICSYGYCDLQVVGC